MELIQHLIEWCALGIEVLAVSLITGVVVLAAGRYAKTRWISREQTPDAYKEYRHQLGQGLLSALDLMVAADVIKTVALTTTLISVATVGLLIVVRTFLSWSVTLEIDGRWPWQRE